MLTFSPIPVIDVNINTDLSAKHLAQASKSCLVLRRVNSNALVHNHKTYIKHKHIQQCCIDPSCISCFLTFFDATWPTFEVWPRDLSIFSLYCTCNCGLEVQTLLAFQTWEFIPERVLLSLVEANLARRSGSDSQRSTPHFCNHQENQCGNFAVYLVPPFWLLKNTAIVIAYCPCELCLFLSSPAEWKKYS